MSSHVEHASRSVYGQWLTTATLAAVVAIVGCSSEPATTTAANPPSEEEIKVFCTEYEQVRDLSRSEMLEALIDHAPPAIAGAVKRAAELGGSHEDDLAINKIIDRCEVD